MLWKNLTYLLKTDRDPPVPVLLILFDEDLLPSLQCRDNISSNFCHLQMHPVDYIPVSLVVRAEYIREVPWQGVLLGNGNNKANPANNKENEENEWVLTKRDNKGMRRTHWCRAKCRPRSSVAMVFLPHLFKGCRFSELVNKACELL